MSVTTLAQAGRACMAGPRNQHPLRQHPLQHSMHSTCSIQSPGPRFTPKKKLHLEHPQSLLPRLSQQQIPRNRSLQGLILQGCKRQPLLAPQQVRAAKQLALLLLVQY